MAKQNSWHNSYDIIEKLGAGGNANVYHVRNKTFKLFEQFLSALKC